MSNKIQVLHRTYFVLRPPSLSNCLTSRSYACTIPVTAITECPSVHQEVQASMTRLVKL